MLGNISAQTSEDSDCHRCVPQTCPLANLGPAFVPEALCCPLANADPWDGGLGVAATVWVLSAVYLAQHLRALGR